MDVNDLLPEDFILPNYRDGSIANVPATVAALLGVPFDGLAPLRAEAWKSVGGGAKRVVLLVLDAMGQNLVEQEEALFARLIQGKTAVSTHLTSVFPSTTVAAMSALWTGYAPAQHGLVGLNLALPDYDTVGFMLTFRASYDNRSDTLIRAGLKPEEFLAVPGFAEQLAAAEVETHAFKSAHIIHSALSNMHGRGVAKNYPVYSFADMLVQMRQLLEHETEKQLLVSAYWSSIDTLSHQRGWNSPATAAELRSLIGQLQTAFLQQLSPAACKDTVFLLVADHGQTLIPQEKRIYLEAHPELAEMLLLFAPGEPRTRYLYCRQGEQTAVLDYINTNLSHAALAFKSEDVLAAGWLGPQPHAVATPKRVGDVVVTMRDGYMLMRQSERSWADPFKATHGGLVKAEMEVPWFALRLD
ncbi:MAG: alkaline phosphatase family protein [Chloroflexota bacterium]